MIINSRLVVVLSIAALALGGCSAQPTASVGKIVAVGAENQYTSVIAQLGGRYVAATSVMSNPNTDPHSFEASAKAAGTISSAELIVQNGLGYDSFMEKIEAATPGSSRIVLSAQKVLGLPDSTRNPHLWYSPTAMPAVARSITAALTKLRPAHRAYFAARLTTFTASMATWTHALARFRAAHPSVPVVVTEPVADYLLDAAGTRNLTPWALQAAIMNGTDPAPQDVAKQNSIIVGGRAKVFLYNQQVADSITLRYLALAKANKVPVVAVYETMPDTGFTYQGWMEAELSALDRAVTEGKSTVKL